MMGQDSKKKTEIKDRDVEKWPLLNIHVYALQNS